MDLSVGDTDSRIFRRFGLLTAAYNPGAYLTAASKSDQNHIYKENTGKYQKHDLPPSELW